jgi:transcriptional accessory protein Tex/SPT6
VKVGDRLKVTVLSVDLQLRRIGLSAKAKPGKPAAREQDERPDADQRSFGKRKGGKGPQERGTTRASAGDGGFANNPFAKLRR